MKSEIAKLLLTVFRTHKFLVLAIILIEFAALVFVRFIFEAPFNPESSYLKNDRLWLSVLTVAGTSLSIAAYLGLLFNSYSNRSWINQLPVRWSILTLVPISLVLINQMIVLFFTAPIAMDLALRSGYSVFWLIFSAPLLVVVFTKNVRNPWLGLIIGLVIFFLLGSFYGTWIDLVFHLWVELLVTGTTLMVITIFEKRSRLSLATMVAAVIVIFITTPIIRGVYLTDYNWRNMLFTLKYYPSKQSIENFNLFWSDEENIKKMYNQPYIVRRNIDNFGNRFLYQFLSTEVKTNLFLFYLKHPEYFQLHKNDRGRSTKEIEALKYFTTIPSIYNILVENWKADRTHCSLLPPIPAEENLSKRFSECYPKPYTAWWAWGDYIPWRQSEYDKMVEDSILQKGVAFKALQNQKYHEEDARPPSSKELNLANRLDFLKWKKSFRKKDREFIQSVISQDRKQLLRNLSTVLSTIKRSNRRDTLNGMTALCKSVSTNCEQHRLDFGYSLSKARKVYNRFSGGYYPAVASLVEEVKKEENWDKVVAIAKTLESGAWLQEGS